MVLRPESSQDRIDGPETRVVSRWIESSQDKKVVSRPHKSSQDDVVFRCNYAIYNMLEKHGMEHLVLDVVKFVLPTDDEVPRLFTELKHVLAKMKLLFVELRGSAVVKNAEKAKRKADSLRLRKVQFY